MVGYEPRMYNFSQYTTSGSKLLNDLDVMFTYIGSGDSSTRIDMQRVYEQL